MRIETDTKLDYSDVLLRPKRSTLASRKEVSLERVFTFKHSGHQWKGIPIMAANMDGVGTFEMSAKLQEYGMITCLVKTYDINDFELKQNLFFPNNTAVSIGTNVADFSKLEMLDKLHPNMIKFICIDIANGYSEHFGTYVSRVRDRFPTKTIIAGNVVTADMAQELVLRGADIIKCGIGPGCFAPGQKIITSTGLKNIEDITVGEKVLTHTGKYKQVTNTFNFSDKKEIHTINKIKATSNHEFYVLNKKFINIVNDDNIHDYAEWVPAWKLNNEFLLIKHK